MRDDTSALSVKEHTVLAMAAYALRKPEPSPKYTVGSK